MPQNDIDTLIMYAPIREADISAPLYPAERYFEVTKSKNKQVKIEKYLVWKLLERAVTDHFNLEFANLQFTKTANGQWTCPDFYFSLSHTDGLVCVAVSRYPVGVDAEIVHNINEKLGGHILTDAERAHMEHLPREERNDFLLTAWVKKESIFKKRGGAALLPNRIETEDNRTYVQRVTVGERPYLISVCCDKDRILFKYTEEI